MVHIVMREIFAPYVMAWHCADEAFDHAPGRIAQKNRAKAISAICASAPSGRKVETYGSRAGGRGVGLVVLGLKFTAYWMTGSIGLYSDTLETTINVLAAGAAFVALGISAQPPDSNHPYGHHKAEYFSAAFEVRWSSPPHSQSFIPPIWASSLPSRSMRLLTASRSMPGRACLTASGLGRQPRWYGRHRPELFLLAR
jgi:hypothetical protein